MSERLPLLLDAAPLPEPPNLGRRLARFIVRAACGASHHELAREFGLTLIEVDRVLFTHGEPPRILQRRPPSPAPLFPMRKGRR